MTDSTLPVVAADQPSLTGAAWPKTPKPASAVLSRDDMMAAVSQGVRDSVNDLLNRDPVRGTAGEWLYLAVREGVSDAVIKIKESRVAVPSGSRRDAT